MDHEQALADKPADDFVDHRSRPKKIGHSSFERPQARIGRWRQLDLELGDERCRGSMAHNARASTRFLVQPVLTLGQDGA